MQPLYFVRHADGSFSEANPQPVPCTTSDFVGTREAATEYALETGSAVCDSGAGECGLQR